MLMSSERWPVRDALRAAVLKIEQGNESESGKLKTTPRGIASVWKHIFARPLKSLQRSEPSLLSRRSQCRSRFAVLRMYGERHLA